MAETSSTENQRDLFQEFSGEAPLADRAPSLAKNRKQILISTNSEQLLLGAILLILVFCFIFFLGMMRGKALRAIEMAKIHPSPAPLAVVLTQRAVPATSTSAPALVNKQAPATFTDNPNAAKPYTIQLVTHKKRENAQEEGGLVRRLGFLSFIIPSGDYLQVCAGQYADKGGARKDMAFFRSRYKDCFLRRR